MPPLRLLFVHLLHVLPLAMSGTTNLAVELHTEHTLPEFGCNSLIGVFDRQHNTTGFAAGFTTGSYEHQSAWSRIVGAR